MQIVIIVGVGEEELNAKREHLLKKIIKQNKIPQEHNNKFELVYTTKVRRGSFNVIIETDPKTFNFLISKEEKVNEVHVGWRNCKIYEHMRIRRCFKCGGYNHFSRDCKEKISCVSCSGEHESRECRSNFKKCINCIRANEKYNLNLDINHAAIDRECKCYLKIVETLKTKTKYEQ